MNKINEISDKNKRTIDKKKRTIEKEKKRAAKSESKRDYRIDKIKALTAKAYAVATKRKWLVFLIGIAIAAYFVISSGGLGGLSGIIDKVKSFF